MRSENLFKYHWPLTISSLVFLKPFLRLNRKIRVFACQLPILSKFLLKRQLTKSTLINADLKTLSTVLNIFLTTLKYLLFLRKASRFHLSKRLFILGWTFKKYYKKFCIFTMWKIINKQFFCQELAFNVIVVWTQKCKDCTTKRFYLPRWNTFALK